MFRTKKDVDKHCQEVFRSIKNERERNLRCLSIAQQYYNVRDYESAKRYVTLYLSVKDDSSVGHKLLAQCYECLQEKEKALSEYKYSLQLDPKQPELILRVCELLAENSIAVDKNQAKYWQEKAETHFPYHPTIFKLKQKITIMGDRTDVDSVESIIMDEVKSRPNDPSVHSKLLSFLIENGRIQEAYNKAFTKMPSFVPTLQWYQSAVQICKAYKTQFPNSINEDFYGNYLLALERTLALSVQDVKIFRKSIPECITFLAKFDELLSTAVSLANKSDNFVLLINHFAGQLCYHKANILYRKVKWDENSVQDVDHFIAPLLLLSISESFSIINYRKQNTAVTRILDVCSRHSAYRVSQAGLVLLSRSKDSQQILENIFHFCVANWRERILEKVYSTSDFRNLCKSSFFANYATFSKLPMDLPRGLTDNVEQFVSVTESTQPASLHHLVWLGVQYLINSGKQSICDRLIPLKFRSTSFRSLQFAPSNKAMSSYAETLSKIDVDAFLYACVYSAESALHQQKETNKSSAFKILPADVSKSLCSPEHELWWESAYQMASQAIPENSFSTVRTVVQRGIEVVRLMGNSDLPLPLLVLLGRSFVNRAAIESNGDLASALEIRASLYWKAAVPLLNKIIRDETYTHSIKSMFDYFGPMISKSEAVNLLNEGKRFHGMQKLKGNNYVDDFFNSEITTEFNANISAAQTSFGGTQPTSVVDEKLLCTLMEQNTKIMDRLETLFNKHELLSTNQLQLYEMVSVLAKKIDVFVIDSLTQAVQPISPQNPSVTTIVSAPQPDVPTYNSLTTPYQYPFAPTGNIQTNFPMYQPTMPAMTSIPHFFANTAPLPSLPPTLPVFDFGGFSASSLTLTNRATTEISKTTAASLTSSLSIGSPLSSTSVNAPQLFSSLTEVPKTPAKSSIFSWETSTPGTTISNESPAHSFQIKVPELNSIVKSPSVQIPEESTDSDDEKRVVEHDPLPDFKPIIPLPDEIIVTTGEEDEEVLFESRAKLFKYADKEWKERGIGMFKVLKNRNTGRVRIVMRREIVHKLCANHFLSADMTLTPMPNNDRAWVYCAPDFSTEEVVFEKLCVKFKTPEIGAEFKKIFDEYKMCNQSTASPRKSETVTPIKFTSAASPLANMSAVQTSVASCVAQEANNASKKIIVAPPSLNVDDVKKSTTDTKPKTSVFSFASAKSDETKIGTDSKNVDVTNSATDSKPKFTGFPFASSKSDDTKTEMDSKLKFGLELTKTNDTKTETDSIRNWGGFTFNSSPIVTQPEQEKPKTEEKPKSTPFSAFSFNVNGDLLKPVSGGSLFGATQPLTTTLETPKPNDVKDESLPFASVGSTIDFSSISKNSASTNAFAKSENFKGFAGAGSLVFGSFPPAKKTASASPAVSAILKNIDTTTNEVGGSATNASQSENTADDEFVPTAEFAPVVPLPDLVEVKTGEEGLELLYEEHCKLFRYVQNEWKERGIGKMKIFCDPKDGSVRMLMRRDQVHKVCCNQRISADVELKPMKTNNKAWTWSNQDYSEGELKNELFCVRFKTIEQAQAFKLAFESGQKTAQNATQSSAKSNATTTQSLPSLAEQFKRDPSTWECKMCYVINKKEADSCTACASPKDGTTTTTSASTSAFGSKFSPAKSDFIFGMPATTSPTSSVFSFGSSDSSKVTSTTTGTGVMFSFGPNSTTNTTIVNSSFTFGNAVTSATTVNAPTFNFGNTMTTSSGPSGLLFSFGTSNSKAVSGGSLFSASTATDVASTTSKPKDNISIFSGSPIKSMEPASTFSLFSFKINENQTPQASFHFGSSSEVNDILNENTTLYKQVPLLIRDENDKLLFKSPAKLYRYVSGEWEARGVGRVHVSRNILLDKCRLLMFREPPGVVACLNHYLQGGVTFVTYDRRSWIWSATDFSEGEITCEKFCLVFENDSNAIAFRTTLESVTDSKSSSEKNSSTDEVEFVSETQISEEDKKLAESLKLPSNYYAYKYSNKSCPGCRGCESEDLKNNGNDNESSKTLPESTSSTDTQSTNKSSFVFGASTDSSWCKGAFNFNNIFNNSSNKEMSSPNASTSETTAENVGNEDEEVVTNDNDPHFEPVIPLPDVIDTKTGEEEEDALFQERAKLFRYDEENKAWKERGIGDLKLLYHPRQNTYRLLLRREQVHKVVLNQRLTSTFALQPLLSSKNSLCWFGMNFSEENNESVLEKLAVRFKNAETVSKFQEVVANCILMLSNPQASRIVNDSRENENNSAEHENTGEAVVDENNYEYNVEEYDEHEDYVDERAIQEAMLDFIDYNYENEEVLYECAATLQVLEDDIAVDYAGVVKIVTGSSVGADEEFAYVVFSTAEVPSLYTACITKETVVIPKKSDGSSSKLNTIDTMTIIPSSYAIIQVNPFLVSSIVSRGKINPDYIEKTAFRSAKEKRHPFDFIAGKSKNGMNLLLYSSPCFKAGKTHESDTITFPIPYSSESDSKAIIRFENETFAESFFDIFEKMKHNYEVADTTFDEHAQNHSSV